MADVIAWLSVILYERLTVAQRLPGDRLHDIKAIATAAFESIDTIPRGPYGKCSLLGPSPYCSRKKSFSRALEMDSNFISPLFWSMKRQTSRVQWFSRVLSLSASTEMWRESYVCCFPAHVCLQQDHTYISVLLIESVEENYYVWRYSHSHITCCSLIWRPIFCLRKARYSLLRVQMQRQKVVSMAFSVPEFSAFSVELSVLSSLEIFVRYSIGSVVPFYVSEDLVVWWL